MKHVTAAPLTAALLLACAGGCGEKRGIEMTYEKTGGIVGAKEQIKVDSAGLLTAQGRVIGERRARLTQAQRDELARLVENWDRLEAPTPVQRGADYFTHAITHAGRTLTWTDLSLNVPPQLKDLARKLEALARSSRTTRAAGPRR